MIRFLPNTTASTEVLVLVIQGALDRDLAGLIEQEGWGLLKAPNVSQALRQICPEKHRILVIQLTRLAEQELRLIQVLRIYFRHVPLIAVATCHTKELELIAREAGASGYFPGPINRRELGRMVADILKRL